MTKRNARKRSEVQQLREELRKEIRIEIEEDLKRAALEAGQKSLREELKKENKGHLYTIWISASCIMFAPAVAYFFPNLDVRIVFSAGALIGAALLITFTVVRGSGFTKRRPANVVRAHWARALIFLLVTVLVGSWVIAGRPARLIEKSKEDYVDQENGLRQDIYRRWLKLDVEPDGSLGILCSGDDCDALRLDNVNSADLDKGSISKAGFEKITIYTYSDKAEKQVLARISLR